MNLVTPPASVSVTVYGIAAYDRGAKIRWLMNEMKLPFDNYWLNRENNEMESAEFLKVSPLGRIPAVKVSGKNIFESGAIVAFLADQHLEKGLAPALHSADRAEYQQWMYFAASSLDIYATRMMIAEDIPAGEVHTQKMESLLADADDAFQFMDQVLSGQDYLVGNRFSAADICVSYHLFWCTLWPEFQTLLVNTPNLNAYLKRMQERPSALECGVFSYEA
jgi:glutathione S-transferase